MDQEFFIGTMVQDIREIMLMIKDKEREIIFFHLRNFIQDIGKRVRKMEKVLWCFQMDKKFKEFGAKTSKYN